MYWFIENIQTILFIASALVVGVLSFWGVFDQKIKARQKELNDQEDRLINLYKTQIDELNKKQLESDKKISELSLKYEKKIQELTDRVSKVNAENGVLKDLIQGKDAGAVEFQKQGLDAIERIRKTESYMVEGFDNVNKNIIRLAKAIEKHLEK